MKKTIWILLFCLVSRVSFAETIGEVEIDFPISHNDWVLLFEQQQYSEDFGDDTDIKIFTHREGDALEVFLMTFGDEVDVNDDLETKESLQNGISEISQFFPYHQFNLITFIDEGDEGYAEWEFHDGNLDLMHGILIKHRLKKKEACFGYFTTAEKTEENLALWKHIINSIKIRE